MESSNGYNIGAFSAAANEHSSAGDIRGLTFCGVSSSE